MFVPQAEARIRARRCARYRDGGWDSEFPDYQLGCTLNTAAGLLAVVRRKRRMQNGKPFAKFNLCLRLEQAQKHLSHLLATLKTRDVVNAPTSAVVLKRVLKELASEGVYFSLEAIEKVHPDKDATHESARLPEKAGFDSSTAASALKVLDTDAGNDDVYAKILRAAAATSRKGGVPAACLLPHEHVKMVAELLSESGLMDMNCTDASIDKEGFNEKPLTLNGPFDIQSRHLKSLLQDVQTPESANNVKGITDNLGELWWEGKWTTNLCLSEYYGFMLFIQSFATICTSSVWSSHCSPTFLTIRGPIMVIQMLGKILNQQNTDGTWGSGMHGCTETTSMAVIALVCAAPLPFLGIVASDFRHAIEKAKTPLLMALISKKTTPLRPRPLWQAYSGTAYTFPKLATALHISATARTLNFSTAPSESTLFTSKSSLKPLSLASFFHSLPTLSVAPFHQLKLGAIESSIYVTLLKSMRNDIFPVTKAKEMDKYMDYIPIMWTMSSFVHYTYVPPALIWDISVLSLFIFLVDEYMEGHISSFTSKEFKELREGIEEIFTGGWKTNSEEPNAPKDATQTPRVQSALSVLQNWAHFHLTYPSLAHASHSDTLNLIHETKSYLLAHLAQLTSNQHLASQSASSIPRPFRAPTMGFAPWLHNIGSGHIGAKIGLTWFSACSGARLRGKGKDCFSTVKQKLMIWNADAHAGKQLRMFNDYGSIVRDAEENNLNSVDFAEFFSDGDVVGEERGGGEGGRGEEDGFEAEVRKQVLLDAAMYERKCTEREMEELYEELRKEGDVGERLAKWVECYYAGGDLFSDMYLVRDVTNSTRGA
ncbi:hypothetical protein M011DRAFT_196271 [Sporormia fimetaria CBS 119925]|uniref:Uncharacterized protein n=1 Tax=Sporormia fimetaria CBS 119925 TaxID=1340428 RepID=A0A6A6V2U8_9PLEO|nr:hypothetical protein M011DRAFT_196271 [Sporormia fimetaria CBS 119925]